MFRVGVIGGGVNGLFISWQLSLQGFDVDLFESGKILMQTSSSSSKLLHGGIRYLEQGHFGLVRESLVDRAWWLNNAPELCHPMRICMPVYKDSPRSLVKLYAGAALYKLISGKHSLGGNSWAGHEQCQRKFPDLKAEGLLGSVSFYDAQMNEGKLGSWVAEKARKSGVKIYENTRVDRFTATGNIVTSKNSCVSRYDFIVNAAGPWTAKLNAINDIDTMYYLRLIRGSHIVLDRKVSGAFLFQEKSGDRVVFVLPYLGKTLVGTTEVPQSIDDEIKCSDQERAYLLNVFNANFSHPVGKQNIEQEFSGLRPIVTSKSERKEGYFSFASREAKLEVSGNVLSIYGGKWTSAPSLAAKVVKTISKLQKKECF